VFKFIKIIISKIIVSFLNKTSSKIALVTFMILFLGIFWWQKDNSVFQLDQKFERKEKTPSLTIKNAEYKGITEEGKKFAISAEMISESSNKAFIRMVNPKINIISDNNSLIINSNLGNFNSDNVYLNLNGNVSIFDKKNGFEFFTKALISDIKLGKYTSTSKVRTSFPYGEIISEGMIYFENEEKLIFQGKTILSLWKSI